MKQRFKLLIITLLSTASLYAQGDLKLWYEQPAHRWVEALPLGNGSMGAMVFGGVSSELIQLNEATLWSGGPLPNNVNPEAYKYLQPIREALANNNYGLADELCRKMQGNYTESYLPLGDLHINQRFKNNGREQNYYRDLNLNNATSTTRFEIDGVTYIREIFVSAPDSIMVAKITADKPSMISLDLSLKSLLNNSVSVDAQNQIILTGKAPARVDPNYYNRKERVPIVQDDIQGCRGMRFQIVLKADPDGGTIHSTDQGLHIEEANSVVLYLSAATSFNGFDKCPDKEGKNENELSISRIKNVGNKTYDVLKSTHTADYKQFFDRVSLILQGKEPSNELNRKLPSDLRLKLYSYGNNDTELETLYFQYGRYLLISSSRPGGTPANLQGLWNKELRAPWSSNYTININTEMNYWPAEMGNLSEMHQPLLRWIGDLSKTGAVTAKEFYRTRGWVAHHNSDIWGLSHPVGNVGDGNPSWANWYMGGNWLCQHLWEHYAFTGDKEYLRHTAYPIMKQAALFSLDWLVEKDGYLMTSPSTSPENTFVINGHHYAVTEASTMDLAIIRDLFTNLIEASTALNFDKSFRKELDLKRAKLTPYRIGAKGQLQEWSVDYQESDPHHRHLSHLFGLHPGRDISPISTPDLANACRRTFEIRGDAGTGWSRGWKINFAARLLDGNHAYKMIREIMRYVDPEQEKAQTGGTYPNFFDAHPPFQIDGNFGASAGVMEMLLQSHRGEIHLLPALPDEWYQGDIKGLKARGNFEVNISWEKGKLREASVKSVLGNPCSLRTSVPVSIDGAKPTTVKDNNWYINTFKTEAGKTYSITAL